MLCPICTRAHSHKNQRFGVSCCRSCAKFFRDNFSQYHTFICRRNNNDCYKRPLSKMAKKCSKCRFNKCLKAGMKMSPLPAPPTFTVTIAPIIPPPPTLLTSQESESFSRTIDTLLDTAVNYPKLLELYLNFEIRTLLNISLEVLKHVTVTPRIQYLSLLFLKYPIAFEELHIVCLICICKLEFRWLPESQQNKIKESQKVCYKRIEEENVKEKRLSELSTVSGHCLNIFNALLTIPK